MAKTPVLPPVEFKAAGESDEARQANLEMAQQIPGFADATLLMADSLDKRVETVLLDFTREAVAMRYHIDGIWHNLPKRDRQSGDAMLASLKCVAGLNPKERQAVQKGTFKVQYIKRKGDCTLTCQGIKTGERVILQSLGDPSPLETLEDLGMREKMRERYKELVSSESGIIVVSAMPKGGLTRTWIGCLNGTDRFMRDFAAVQSESFDEPEVINISPVTYNAKAGKTPVQAIEQLMLKQPDVLVLPELKDPQTATELCRLATDEQKLIFTRIHAKRAEEALLRILMLKVPPDKFAQAVIAAVNVRLVRRLCEQCRQPYKPAPQMLQSLGIPPGRIEAFYRPWQPPPPGQADPHSGEAQICSHCNGLGYRGQIGIFELLVVDDRLRQALVKQPKLDVLRQVARQSGHHSMQEEGILLVCQGVTSLAEVQRVLKQ